MERKYIKSKEIVLFIDICTKQETSRTSGLLQLTRRSKIAKAYAHLPVYPKRFY